MADEANGAASAADANGAASAAAAQPRLQMLTQYIRDLSFENIAVQKGLTNADGKPDVKVQINLDVQQRAGDRYEVALKVNVDSKVGDSQVFILELDYAGLFFIQNVPQDQLHPLLMIECPRLVFPYVRRVVGDITRDGGYPPLNLDQIDFLALYRQEVVRRQLETAEPTQA